MKQVFDNRLHANRVARTPVKDFFKKAVFVSAVFLTIGVGKAFSQRLVSAQYTRPDAPLDVKLDGNALLVNGIQYGDSTKINMKIDIGMIVGGGKAKIVQNGENPCFSVANYGQEERYALLRRDNNTYVLVKGTSETKIQVGDDITPKTLLDKKSMVQDGL